MISAVERIQHVPTLVNLNINENLSPTNETLNKAASGSTYNMTQHQNNDMVDVLGPKFTSDQDLQDLKADGRSTPTISATTGKERLKSAGIQQRRPTLQTQGGGFMRTQTSGYFQKNCQPSMTLTKPITQALSPDSGRDMLDSLVKKKVESKEQALTPATEILSQQHELK